MRDSGRIAIRSLVLNKCDGRARNNGRVIHLTRREFDLLWTLASHPGKVLGRRELLAQVWGPKEFVEPRTVDAHIVKIRKKLQACPVEGLNIETVWGMGYRLQLPSPEK